ncbi:hypothetical protein [Streptomyces sp. NPDC001435]|uniref:imine reductase family protein n=1 Tax=Streptomyces sp. NPDC001435 TaxID=3364576 RepID=UPI00367EAF44
MNVQRRGTTTTTASTAATTTPGHLVETSATRSLDTRAPSAAKHTADRAVAAGHGTEGPARLATVLGNDEPV